MQNFTKSILMSAILLSYALLSGCSHTVTLKTEGGVEQLLQPQTDQVNSSIIPQATFHTHSLFSDYTDSIATQLVETANVNLKGLPLIITSFGYQARVLEDNHQLSYQLSESISHDLQPFGVRTINAYQQAHLTYLDATGLQFDEGTKNILSEFSSNHVLTGIITPNERGIMIHAKVVVIDSMQVISTAQKFIPYYAFSH